MSRTGAATPEAMKAAAAAPSSVFSFRRASAPLPGDPPPLSAPALFPPPALLTGTRIRIFKAEHGSVHDARTGVAWPGHAVPLTALLKEKPMQNVSPVISVRPVVLPAPGRGEDLRVRVSAPATGGELP